MGCSGVCLCSSNVVGEHVLSKYWTAKYAGKGVYHFLEGNEYRSYKRNDNVWSFRIFVHIPMTYSTMDSRHFLASTSNCCSASFADETILASRWENWEIRQKDVI